MASDREPGVAEWWLRVSGVFHRRAEEPSHPMEQLTLVQEEISRERPLLLQRIASMHTRASLLVTASGVFSVVQARQPDSYWQYVGVALAVAAAVIALMALRPKIGEDALASKYIQERLEADVYSTQYSITMDAAQSLDNDADHLKYLGKRLSWGFALLVTSLGTSTVISFLHSMQFV